MKKLDNALLSLVQVAMGIPSRLPEPLSEEEWIAVRRLSEQHRLLAMAFIGMQQLDSDMQPSKSVQIEWALQSELIKKANERRDYLCRRAFVQLSENHIPCVVLKGQANCMNYPESLRAYRQPGDIDLWVGRDLNTIVDYVYRWTRPKEGIRYNHVDFPVISDVPIELHYRPIFLCQPLRNCKVQRWLREQWERGPYVEYKDFQAADNRMNVTYHLLHLFRHLFEEGIAIRQIIDYIYVLRNYSVDCCDAEIMREIESFGLTRFAGGIMWMARQFDPEVPILCQPDEREGRYLWKNLWEQHRWGKTRNDIHLLRHYPGEALSEPIFRLWHAFWRLKTRIRLGKATSCS